MIDLTADSDDEPTAKRGVVDLTADSDDEPQPKKQRPDTSGDAEFARALAAGRGDDWRRRAPAPLPAPTPAAKAAKAPPWEGKRGTQRMFAEFRALQKWEGSPRVYDAEMVMDQANVWRFKVKDFDNSVKGGKQLNKDLRELRGQDHILMEVRFPRDYPNKPFLLRCVSPRFVWYTGHVTAGGSICIEALTTTGGAGAWRSSYCVESILNTVFTNMLHCEVTHIRTATGPGGKSGPLRVDLKCKHCRSPLHEYSLQEATSAFDRMLHHHAANGW